MPLHNRKDLGGDTAEESVYSSADLSVSMPKYRMPEKEHSPRHAYQVVHDELMLDGNSRQNLATFCQTWAEPEVHKLMDECRDKNMIDKDEDPQTAESEGRCSVGAHEKRNRRAAGYGDVVDRSRERVIAESDDVGANGRTERQAGSGDQQGGTC